MLAVILAAGWITAIETPQGWRFRSPDGECWKARGVEKVRMEPGFPGPRDGWAKETAAQLRDWGFNLIGSGSDWKISEAEPRFATTEMLAVSMWMKDRGDEYRLSLTANGFCDELANVFHPRFAEVCDLAARECATRHRDDRNLVGYFLDNELNWWGEGNWRDCGLMDYAIAKMPPGHTARVAAERFKARFAPDIEKARRKFTEEVAERYFSTIVKAIRRYDRNHLILGVRFAGIYGAPDAVWKIAGKWCDVVTLNCYPHVDLDKKEVWLPVQKGDDPNEWTRRTLHEMLTERYRICGKPLMISEWSFLGLDVPNPHRLSVAQEFPTQRERARAAGIFRQFTRSCGFVIGDVFYRFADEPAKVGETIEIMNWGLVDSSGRPHVEIVSELRKTH